MAGVAAVAFVVISGVVPIKASSGHWRITAALLDVAKTRSVATHSLGLDTPDLDDETLVLKGAGHYEGACLQCHGGPGRAVPPVAASMTPPPPELTARVARWAPRELFTIVKHGIKFTGMPAWPDERRDDEVWAMVAFLLRMPDLDGTEYRRLAAGEPGGLGSFGDSGPVTAQRTPRIVREVCQRCHGIDGTGRGAGAFPSLAGQRFAYLYASLQAFRDGSRFSGVMKDVAARLDDAAMREIAAYFERLPPRQASPVADAQAMERGQVIATQGRPERDIPACVECHGPAAVPKNPGYPRLASQHARYLRSQLELLQQRHRGGTINVNLMEVFVDRLRPDEIRDVTLYFEGLSAWSPTSNPPDSRSADQGNVSD
jgi:cytochrome c553